MTSIPAGHPSVRRFLMRISPALAAASLAALLTIGLSAQDAAKPPPKEEVEEPAKDKPAKGKIEEQDPTAKPLKKIRLDDAQLNSLAQEADQASNPDLQSFYRSLALPHDLVTMKNGNLLSVAPVPRLADPLAAPLQLQAYDEQGQPKKPIPASKETVKEIDYYEQLTLRQVDEFLKKTLDREPPESPKFLSRLDMLKGAEKVLKVVIGFHETAKASSHAERPDLEKPLRDKLLDVQVEQLRVLADSKNWEGGFELAVALADVYRGQDAVRARLVEQLARFINQSLEEEHYGDVHLRLKLLEEQFPQSDTHTIQQKLRDKAEAKYNEAMTVKDKDAARATRLFSEAESIWPRLPNLREQIIKLSKDHPILYVGVRKLPEKPEYLSPALARTDTERQMGELLFESLVRPPVGEAKAGQRFYLPELALDRPRLVPLGRQFVMVRDAYWPAGEQVTAADVRQTWRMLQTQGKADLIEDIRPGDNPFQVNVSLSQGYLDPLSLMTFKVLPPGADPTHNDNPKFKERPYGSGPYEYRERREGHDIFLANSAFHRSGKPGLPLIPEVHFFEPKNPEEAFLRGQLHILLGQPTDALRRFSSLNKVSVQTMRNRRIYFLAINHRKPELAGNLALRRAIANAIDREKLLNDNFRDKENPHNYAAMDDAAGPHRALNGPYPPDSWAPDPKVPAFDFKLAQALAKQAGEAGGRKNFSLKYPKMDDDDHQIEAVCNYIKTQVANLGTGIDFQLEARTPRQFHKEVEEMQDYDFAYEWFDYASEAYDLWPLFDSSELALGQGGRNFLHYSDGHLKQLLQQAREHRDFEEVKKITHQIHDLLSEQMPFVPLWQLDTHVILHGDLTARQVDPLLIFSDIQEWELNRK